MREENRRSFWKKIFGRGSSKSPRHRPETCGFDTPDDTLSDEGPECHEDGDREMCRGDLVTWIMGIAKDGNQATASRWITNWAVLEATENQKKVYSLLVQAFYRCLHEVKPGVGLDRLDKTARRVMTEGGCGGYGYWNYNEPLFWILTQGWISFPLNSNIILREGNIFNIEPSIKMPSLTAWQMTMSGDKSWTDDEVVKVGGTVFVTKDGYKLLGEGPPEKLLIIGPQK